ncbi:MAG: hypothetical protein FJY85_02360 [Deltaproteobacteria bacterium]|nr:hypothetical protein [Deltaproteobacteria bacterium]
MSSLFLDLLIGALAVFSGRRYDDAGAGEIQYERLRRAMDERGEHDLKDCGLSLYQQVAVVSVPRLHFTGRPSGPLKVRAIPSVGVVVSRMRNSIETCTSSAFCDTGRRQQWVDLETKCKEEGIWEGESIWA